MIIININNTDPEDLYVAKHNIDQVNGKRTDLSTFLKNLDLQKHIYHNNVDDVTIAFALYIQQNQASNDKYYDTYYLFVSMDDETNLMPIKHKKNEKALHKILDLVLGKNTDDWKQISSVELTEKAFYDSKYYDDYFIIDDKIYVNELQDIAK